MISAQLDSVMQEHLIEKYMLLPNQVWDDIISQAAKVLNSHLPNYFEVKITVCFTNYYDNILEC